MSNKALSKNLLRQLVAHGKIKTTAARAKILQSLVDKVINRAKEENSVSRRFLLSLLPVFLAKKIEKDIVSVFKKRTGGFTRIIKLGKRVGDNAQMVLVEWVETIEVKKKQSLRSNELAKLKVQGETEEKTAKKTKVKISKKKVAKKVVKKEKKNDKADKNK